MNPPSQQPVAVYYANRNLSLGSRVWAEMVRELWGARELVWRLFCRDFSAKYRQTIFGILWAILLPVGTTAFFVVLSNARVINIGQTSIPYPLFALIGASIWQSFVGGLMAASGSLVSASNLVGKINFPREALVIAAIGQAVLDALVKAGLVALMMAYYRIWPGWEAVAILPLMLFLFLMCLGFGFLLALVQGIVRDTEKALSLLITFGVVLTPAVYPPPQSWPASLINIANPVSPFLIAIRDLATGRHVSNDVELALGVVVSLLVFGLSWRIFHLAEPKIAERL
jgi:lipopolysaccharide transport system permease protein